MSNIAMSCIEVTIMWIVQKQMDRQIDRWIDKSYNIDKLIKRGDRWIDRYLDKYGLSLFYFTSTLFAYRLNSNLQNFKVEN